MSDLNDNLAAGVMPAEIKIGRLKFPDNIRKRSGMYIGSTLDPRVIIRELADNSGDELMAGHATYVDILAREMYSIVLDDGRGVPLYIDPEDETVTITRALFTESHVGSKFDSEDDEASMGMNGIGTKATNALSARFICVVNLKIKDLNTTLPWIKEAAEKLQNPAYVIEWRSGIFHKEVVVEAATLDTELDTPVIERIEAKPSWSTCMVSYPEPYEEVEDEEGNKVAKGIFKSMKFEYDTASLEINAMFLTGDRYIALNDKRIQPFSFRKAFDKTKFLNDQTFQVDFECNKFRFVTIFGFSADDFAHSYKGSVNTLTTNEGFHIRFIRNKVLGAALAKKYPILVPSDAQYGLRQFTLVKCKDPEFNSQTKERLDWIKDFTENDVAKAGIQAFNDVMNEHPEYFEALKDRIVEYKREIGKLALKDFVNSVVQKGDEVKRNRGLGAAVYDCTSPDREKTELFIVEGRSAGSNMLQARDERYMAVLPLRGKPLNTVKVDDLEEVLKNPEMLSMINIIGCGISPFVDLSKARYGKVILLADADPDGKNICALLIGTFGTYLPEAVEAGMIYVSEIPLYKQDGKFLYDEEGLDRSRRFTRFKGLGEMNPSELEECVVTADTRRLIQITSENMLHALDIIRSAGAKRKLMLDNHIIVE